MVDIWPDIEIKNHLLLIAAEQTLLETLNGVPAIEKSNSKLSNNLIKIRPFQDCSLIFLFA